jgi:hypothetical protein
LSLPVLPTGWEWIEGISTNGDIYLAFRGRPAVDLEVGIFVCGLGMNHWRVIERPSRIILGKKRMKEIRNDIQLGKYTIADLVPAPATQKNWGRF